MYGLLGLALIINGFAWHYQAQLIWYITMAIAIAIATLIHVTSLYSDIFIKQSIHCMERPKCCCIHNCWSNPNTIISTTIFFRTLAGILAVLATLISYAYTDEFANKKYFTTTLSWTIAVGIWLISCLPFTIALIQCAAETPPQKKSRNPKPIAIGKQKLEMGHKLTVDDKTIKLASGHELIVRFRQIISMQLLHDIVIGIFWMYLAIMLYDLCDDEDDSNWRTIFLSMISWHIVFQTLYHTYLKNIWSCTIIHKNYNKSSACCAPSHAENWWSILQLSGLAAIYMATIIRMKEIIITDMGCAIETLIYIVYGALAFCLGNYMLAREIHGTEYPTQLPVNFKPRKNLNNINF